MTDLRISAAFSGRTALSSLLFNADAAADLTSLSKLSIWFTPFLGGNYSTGKIKFVPFPVQGAGLLRTREGAAFSQEILSENLFQKITAQNFFIYDFALPFGLGAVRC